MKRGHLDVPVIGVAKSGWNLEQLQARARESIEQHGGTRRGGVRPKLAGLLRYVDGDYSDAATFQAITQGARRRAAAGALSRDSAGALRHGGRAARRRRTAPAARASIVEKPFGHDLASAQASSTRILLQHVRRGRTSFASTTISASGRCTTWCSSASRTRSSSRSGTASHVKSVQITMAENFGVQGRGAFYDQIGTIRDVIQNHLFQVLAQSRDGAAGARPTANRCATRRSRC